MNSPPSLYEVPIPGLHLIEASAGTGKTWALTLLFLRALTEGPPVDRILVVTFTEAATADMKNRIHGLLVDARDYAVTGMAKESYSDLLEKVVLPAHSEILSRTLAEFDRAPIMTIHAFCRRLLREYAFEFETPFELDLEEDDASLKSASAREIWRRRIYPENPEIARLTAALFPGGPEEISELFSFTDLAGRGDPAGAISWKEVRARYLLLLDQCQKIGDPEREEIVRAFVAPPARAGSGRRKKLGPGDPALWPETEVRARLRDLCSGRPDPPPGFSGMDPALLTVLSGMEGSPGPELLIELLGQADLRNKSLRASLKEDLLAYSAGEWLKEKERRGVETYDDMIFRVLLGLEKDRTGTLSARIRERFPVAFIDEFQDTDQAQARIFDRIYRITEVSEGREELLSGLFLIGDPKQSIYGFRGADLDAYLSVRKKVISLGSRNLFSLSVNYRSDQSHVDAINHLFQISSDPFMTGGEIPWTPVDAHHSGPLRLLDPGQGGGELRPPVLFYVGEGGREETLDHFSGICALEIRRLLSSPVLLPEGPVRPGDIAVLVRTHRHGKLIQEALGRIGVPSVAFDPEGVLKSLEALELEILLLALSSPADRRKVRSALVSSFFGTPAMDLIAYERSEEEWNRRVTPFFDVALHWSWRGPMGSLRRFFLDEGLFANLGKLPGGRRRITNVLHLFEILESLGRDRCPLLLLADRYVEARREARRKKGEGESLRLDSLADRVKIMTLHKSKGLEFPVVFLPFGMSAREESPGKDGSSGNDLPGEEEASGGAEEMRLLYVALTRARHRTCLMIPVLRQKQRALARLFGIVTEKPGGRETNELFRQEIRKLVSDFPGLFGMIPAGEQKEGLFSGLSAEGEPRLFRSRELSRPIPSPRTQESFTSLTRSLHGGEREYEGEHPLRRDEGESAAEREGVPDDLPAGPLFGTFFHRIMEILATRENPGEGPPSFLELKETGEQALREVDASLNPECRDWPERVLPLVLGTLMTPFAPSDRRSADLVPEMTLFRIFRGIRAVEREFLMPVRDLVPQGLSGLLLDSGPRLSFDPVSGYLRGFIDLIFCQEGRYYLLDYKTNRLESPGGASPYAPENLAAAMAGHRYDLQGLLYCLALHRILSLQMDRYAFGEHFGGVFFLFVRGLVVPGAPPGNGVFHDRPSLDKIRAFERLLGSGRTATGGME